MTEPAAEVRFQMLHERVEVSYLTQASVDEWYAALADQQKRAIDKGAAMLAESTGVSVESARDAFIRHLAANGSGNE